jgi:hypothetical protein
VLSTPPTTFAGVADLLDYVGREGWEVVDLSGNLIVQLGLATEDLNRQWYERITAKMRFPVPHQ